METERYAAEDGLELCATLAGPKDGPVVVLSHGGGQTRQSWFGAMRELAKRGYRAIAVDTRGHGDSGWSSAGHYGFDAMAGDLVTVARENPGPLSLVGASLGGMTALYALGHGFRPDTKALILVDIVPRPARAGMNKITDFMKRHGDGFANIDEVVEAVAAYNPNRPRPSDPSGLHKNLRLRDDGRLYWHWDPRILDLSDLGIDQVETQIADACAGLRTPTLLVRGGDSDVVDDKAIADVRELIPGVEVYDVAGAGHMVAGDRNDAFNAGILQFLALHMPV